MRIKKVGAICNAGGCYYLMDERDAAGEIVGQWLGDGKSAYPLETSAGVTFIQEKYLLPLDGLEYMRLYERRGRNGDLFYIVAKIGMMIQAVIMPMDLPDKDFMEALNDLTSQCRDAMRKKALIPKQESVPERETGPLFQVDASTGEVVGEGVGE